MALPFIAGIALGAGIAFAFTKRDEIAKSFKGLNLDKKLKLLNSPTLKSVKEKVVKKPRKTKSTAKQTTQNAENLRS
ncbi:hypothetical protein [Campylobacter porcelli]|uniref:Uncharacterized protein n=1 Tax=Campylobacter porcelli TaxID=1660073 RepID=A0A1X9SUM4_9BACT|nr:hypothetical protein [Campylobacter sp. RM6137]ARQ99920.1 hypothetical protein CSUIS_0064 [Campylobacter sp. RM6137]